MKVEYDFAAGTLTPSLRRDFYEFLRRVWRW